MLKVLDQQRKCRIERVGTFDTFFKGWQADACEALMAEGATSKWKPEGLVAQTFVPAFAGLHISN